MSVTVEEAAEAAYIAGMGLRTDKRMPIHRWVELPEHWKKIYRAQAGAVLTLAAPSLFDFGDIA